MACDLQVHVDGEVFFVNEGMLSSFRGNFDKSPAAISSQMRIIQLDGFPGGPEVFELIANICYSSVETEITPTNTCLLWLANQYFMKMSKDFSFSQDLVMQMETSLCGISSWTNSELLLAMRQCRDHFQISDSCHVFEKVLRSLVERIKSANDYVLPESSPESSRFRFSFDARSIGSTKNSGNSCCLKHWWLEGLILFHVDAIDRIVHTMVSEKIDHSIISKFLLYFLKSRCSISSTSDEKVKMVEIVIDHLHSLEITAVSCRGLFEILRLSSSLNLRDHTREILDNMIGSLLDQATLDNMLIPSPVGIDTLYDVDQVLRFLKFFLQQKGCSDLNKLKKVGSLMDLYLAEAAPDPGLKMRKFVSLAMALPRAARENFDGIYRAIDMYIELHRSLSEEEKIVVCCTLDFEKISSEVCKHIAQNAKMPSWIVIKALMSQQSKLRGLLQSSNNYNSSRDYSPCGKDRILSFHGKEQTVLYAKRISIPAENEDLKTNLEGMQWKVMELEDVCRKMQTQMRNIVKTTGKRPSRFLPKLCS